MPSSPFAPMPVKIMPREYSLKTAATESMVTSIEGLWVVSKGESAKQIWTWSARLLKTVMC